MSITLLVLALVLQTKPTGEHHPGTDTNQKTSTQEQGDSSSQNGVLPTTYNVTNRNEQGTDTHKMEERRYQKVQLCVGVIGVLGAWVGLGLLIWQNILTRRSADAALLNAQAVINADRPWVIVMMVKGKNSGNFTFKASNEGRSPAVILSIFSQHKLVSDPSNLPVPPEYGQELPNRTPLLMPNVGHDLFGQLIDLCSITSPVIPNDTHLVFWFKIIYTTQLAIEAKILPYETRYCCEYSPAMTADLKIAGPAAYNKYA